MGVWNSVFKVIFGARPETRPAPSGRSPPAQPRPTAPPVATPAPAPEPMPTPPEAAEPAPGPPAPAPAPEPAPAPPVAESEPAPAPTPDPAPSPEHEPAPAPEPSPAPTPEPAPAPAPAPSPTAAQLISLGCIDPEVGDENCAAYMRTVEDTTRLKLSFVADTLDKVSMKRLPAKPDGAMSVADVQRALTAIGFFPGGAADGICGYRTQSAIRLFQEYVRTMEGQADCIPDGLFGPRTQAHLQRWLASGAQANWAPVAGEYEAWLALLDNVKQKYLAAPNRALQLVNAFPGRSDTRKVADWDFAGLGNIHLVGVRRQEITGKYDDLFLLLMKGLVFKFQGSTEPGVSDNPRGPPHLVQGQHDYHFGWHPGAPDQPKPRYLALRPLHLDAGVLVVRAGADKVLDDADYDRGLEANPTINIHWGGRGMARDNTWSAGCQVINGEGYINPANQLISCARFAATFSSEPTRERSKTRGAYNVLVDLVTALSGDMPSNQVKYTLLVEEDLDLAPALKQKMAEDRARALTVSG